MSLHADYKSESHSVKIGQSVSIGSMDKPVKTIRIYQEVSVSSEAQVKLIKDIIRKMNELLEMTTKVSPKLKITAD